jgi:hypothetical protein
MSPQLPFDEPVPTQGARAGTSGQSLEAIVEALFSVRKVRAVNDNREYHYEKDIFERKDKLLIRQPLINGWRVDFLYKNFRNHLVVPIECKQQLGGGTTDEKLAHTVDKLIACAKALNCSGYWLVLGGGGFSHKMIHVIQNKIKETNGSRRLAGRCIFSDGPFLQRAIDALVEKNLP